MEFMSMSANLDRDGFVIEHHEKDIIKKPIDAIADLIREMNEDIKEIKKDLRDIKDYNNSGWFR